MAKASGKGAANVLEVSRIYKTFNAGTVNEKKALQGLSLKLNEGDFVTVIGGNGAGKSTLLNAVAGVWPVDAGRIVIDGVDVTGLSEHKRAKYIGPRVSGPYDGHRRHHADRRKPGPCQAPRPAAHPAHPASRVKSARNISSF